MITMSSSTSESTGARITELKTATRPWDSPVQKVVLLVLLSATAFVLDRRELAPSQERKTNLIMTKRSSIGIQLRESDKYQTEHPWHQMKDGRTAHNKTGGSVVVNNIKTAVVATTTKHQVVPAEIVTFE